jgi:hypothetical protein
VAKRRSYATYTATFGGKAAKKRANDKYTDKPARKATQAAYASQPTRKAAGKAALAKYQRANRDKLAAQTARREAGKIQATPAWETPAMRARITEHYEMAAVFGGCHVDHIVPLRSRLVCGLHVFWNLRPWEAGANMRKGNRLDANPPLPPDPGWPAVNPSPGWIYPTMDEVEAKLARFRLTWAAPAGSSA